MADQHIAFTSLEIHTDGRVKLVDDEVIAYTMAYSSAMTLINQKVASATTSTLNDLLGKKSNLIEFSFKKLKEVTYNLIRIHPYRSVHYMEHLLILGVAAATHSARKEGLIYVHADTPHKDISSFLPDGYTYDYKPNYHNPTHTLMVSHDRVCMVVPKTFSISCVPQVGDIGDTDTTPLVTLGSLMGKE